MDLKDKVAVVTGGSRGIGRAIVERLASQGLKIVIASRNEGPSEAVAAEIASIYDGRCVSYQCDVRKEQECFNLIDATVCYFGQCDILINNAGIQKRTLSFRTITILLAKRDYPSAKG